MGRFAFIGPAEVIAHRGFSAVAPENTLAAIEAGIRAGADAVEFDIRCIADNTPVLFHDSTLRRTTDGSGDIVDTTISDLRRLDAGAWFDDAYEGERVPTLKEALELIGDRLPRVYVEIKDLGDVAGVDRIVEVSASSGLIDRIVFIAMDWSLLDRARAVEADSAVGYIVRRARELNEAVDRAKGDPAAMIDFGSKVLFKDPSIPARLRELGIPAAVWTVDDPLDATRLLEMGVPRITTNQVSRLVEWRSTL